MTEQGRPTPEALANISREDGRVRERNFDVLPTHIPDVFLLVDHGEEPDLSRSSTRDLMDLGITYAITSQTIDTLTKQQEDPHRKLVSLGVHNPGLRGFRDTAIGIEVQITPKTTDKFDANLLHESLGDREKEVVHKKVSITVEFDPDTEDADGFIKSVKRRLKRQGLSKEAIEDRVKIKKPIRVDEKALQKMVEAGEVVLLPGTWGFSINNWDVVPRKIKSKSELAEAQEAARAPKTS